MPGLRLFRSYCRLAPLLATLFALSHTNSYAQPFPTTLAYAVERNDLDLAKSLLAKGVDANSKDYRGRPVLYTVAYNGNVAFAEALVKAGADVNVADGRGETPLHAAAAAGSAEIVKLLVSHGAHVDAASRRGLTPLMLAAAGGRITKEDASGERDDIDDGYLWVEWYHRRDSLLTDHYQLTHDAHGEEAVKALAKLGANINARSVDGFTALWWAVATENLEKVRQLLRSGADPNLNPKLTRPILDLAISDKQPAIVRELLAHHANPNYADQAGITPLGAAIEWHQSVIAVMLLEAGADINKLCVDWEGYGGTAPLLFREIRKRDSDWVHFLLFHHADVNAGGGVVLSDAIRERDVSLVKEILKRHAVLNGLTTQISRFGDQITAPLNYLAAQVGMIKRMDPDILELLLAHGAWINALNGDGVDALFEAAQQRDPSALKVLLKHGADPNSRDAKGVTALMIAADYRLEENVRLLLQAGADTVVRDSERETAFSHAAAHVNLAFYKEFSAPICDLLLARGADVNNIDRGGRTPLMIAVMVNDKNAVTYLLQHGANKTIRDYSGKGADDGKTALMYAVEMKRTEIIQLLK